MSNSDIEKISRNISETEKKKTLDSLKSMNSESIRESIANLDLDLAAKTMRQLNLNEAADKLESMTGEDIINQISKNPQVLEKLKKIFN